MMTFKKPALGTVTQSRTALAVFAATLLVGGSVTEASAKSHGITITPSPPPSRQQFAQGRSSRFLARRQCRDRPSSGTGRSFSGMASYYGNESGSQTASGQRFNQNAMTCAHRSLPFGTKLRVTHGGRSVVVTVNDRGPFVRGRVLDLSTGAARAIGLTSAGVGRVTAEVIS